MTDIAERPRAPIDVLAHTDFFVPLEGDQLARVGAIGRMLELPEGHLIYKHGQAATHFYVLAEGMVRFALGFGSRNAAAGETLRKGNVFGWAALIPGAKLRIATASCVTPCSILAIDGEAFVELMEQDPSMGFQVMKQVNLLITGTLAAFAAG